VKQWNTAILLEKSLEGAATEGANTERFNPGKKPKSAKIFFPKDCERAYAIGVKFAKIEN